MPYRTVQLGFAALIAIVVSSLSFSVGYAQDDIVREAVEPPTSGVFRCPPIIDVWEELPAKEWSIPAGYSLERWSYYRLDPERVEPPLATGTSPEFFYRDTAAKLVEDNEYALESVWTKSGSDNITKTLSIDVSNDGLCTGDVIRDLTIDGETIEVYRIVVYPNVTLAINETEVRSPGAIVVNNHAALQLESSQVISTGLFIEGGTLALRSSDIRDGTIHLFDTDNEAESLIEFTTFSGVYDPSGFTNWIRLSGDSQIKLDTNIGAWGVELTDNTSALLTRNDQVGAIKVNDAASVYLFDNTLSGSLWVMDRSAPSSPPSATVISSTIVLTDNISPPPDYMVRVENQARLYVLGSRLDNQIGTRVLHSYSGPSNADITVSYSDISGDTEVLGQSVLTLINNRSVRGSVSYGDNVTAEIAGNTIYADIRASGESFTAFRVNEMPEGSVWLSGDAKGTFMFNTFSQSSQDSGYAFEFAEYLTELPRIIGIGTNCIERNDGVHLNGVAGVIKLNGNWWGDPSGPSYVSGNPEGTGARISVTSSPTLTLEYEEYETTRPSICDANPLGAGHSVTTTFGAEGGTVYLGPLVFEFPAGAVEAETNVVLSGALPFSRLAVSAESMSSVQPGIQLASYSQSPIAKPASGRPPTGNLMGNAIFNLSASNEATVGEMLQLLKPFEMTVHYDPRSLGVKEDIVSLYHQQDNVWSPVPDAVVDTERHTITATFDRFGLFAILGEAETVYLPPVLQQ